MCTWRWVAGASLMGLSGCFFLTDFDGLAGGETSAAGGAGGTGGTGGTSSGVGGGTGGGGATTTTGGGGSTGGTGGTAGGGTGGLGGGGGSGGAGGGGGGVVAPAVVINELVVDPLPNEEDWVEFYNADTIAADISGWSFSDGGNQFTFPASTVLASNSYLVLERNAPGSFTFGLSKNGETVTLRTAGNAMVDTTTWTIGQAEQPNSWGRLPNGTGSFQALTPTKGGGNQ